MAKNRKITLERKVFITQLLESYKAEYVIDVKSMLKYLLSDTFQDMLETKWK